MNEKGNKLIQFIGEKYQNNEISNEVLVQIIELAGGYLNLQTITDYAKANNISYNGAKKFRKNIELFGVKFIIDNE